MYINLPSRPKTVSKCMVCGRPTYDTVCSYCEEAAAADARRKRSPAYMNADEKMIMDSLRTARYV